MKIYIKQNRELSTAEISDVLDEDWSQDSMLAHGRELYSIYGPGNFDDMTDYDWECHQLYQRSL